MIVITAIVGTAIVLIGMCFGPTSQEYKKAGGGREKY